MDPIKNPFSPGAGSPPPELVGRDPLLVQADVVLGRIKQRKADKSMLLTGLRGVGKTVLLKELERRAKPAGYLTIDIEAPEGKGLGAMIAPPLRTLLFELDRMAGAKDKVKRAMGALRGFLGALKLSIGDRFLLADSLFRVVRSEIATYAVIVDAKDDAAHNFYKRESFLPFPDGGMRLFRPVADFAGLFG